ncbi:sensor histidine kinase [Persicitalea jodogahamensis]|uniref:histidine kinase n=1 Tax=Persicitalea jodogahamensis TaxID=402147 RepID=A0A8J3D935_9BACT|nr:ATP-binding protein [Persicitalea jodogahamensis]GHB70760.1 two-component sensor histidine kinase [Persicitalea jodogahamensis]
MKIKTKIILLISIISLLFVVLYSGFIYYASANYSFEDFYKRLEIRAVTTAKIQLENGQDLNAIKEVKQEYLEILPEEKIYILPVPSEDSLQAEAIRLNIPISALIEIKEQKAASFRQQNIFYSGIRYTAGATDYIVIVSAENYYYTHHIAYLRNLLVSLLVFAVVLVIIISFWFSKKLIQPLQDITTKMEDISSENLQMRLPLSRNDDELSTLSNTFNGMLDRLEAAFESQKNFVSNASHELNTPLTSIIGEADVILSKSRTAQEYREAMVVILDAAEKLSKKTKALLFLAQTGYNGKVVKFDKVRIDQLIWDVKGTVDKIYPGNKVILDYSLLPENPENLQMLGNEQLLHLALSNVIMNACKYSNDDIVQVSLGASVSQIIIVVKDRGIGIPDTEIKYIYDPYFRASNTNAFEGYGIGLPLSRNVVKMHRGELLVTSVLNEGVTVEIRLPINN